MPSSQRVWFSLKLVTVEDLPLEVFPSLLLTLFGKGEHTQEVKAVSK